MIYPLFLDKTASLFLPLKVFLLHPAVFFAET